MSFGDWSHQLQAWCVCASVCRGWNLFAAPCRSTTDARSWRSLAAHAHVDTGARLLPRDEEQVGQAEGERERGGEAERMREREKQHMRIHKAKISWSARSAGGRARPPRAMKPAVTPQLSGAQERAPIILSAKHLKWADPGGGQHIWQALQLCSLCNQPVHIQKKKKNSGNKWGERAPLCQCR